MRRFFLVIVFLSSIYSSFADQNKDYVEYHRTIANIENTIYLKKEIQKGLDAYRTLFEQYDFIFLDDCLDAAILAYYIRNYKDAEYFIRVSSKNGLELYMLSSLMYGWFYDSCKHSLYTKFVNFASPLLNENNSINRINLLSFFSELVPSLIKELNKRHIYEQLCKDSGTYDYISQGRKTAHLIFDSVNHNNIDFLDSLARKGIFMTERNIGFNSEHFYNSLKKGISIEEVKKEIYPILGISLSFLDSINSIDSIVTIDLGDGVIAQKQFRDIHRVPTGDSIFVLGIPNRNIIVFHCDSSFSYFIAKYMDEAIKLGYWHPRECAMFYDEEMVRQYDSSDSLMMVSRHTNSENGIINRLFRDSLRHRFYLPSYEVDSLKHLKEVELGITLFFNKMVYECR